MSVWIRVRSAAGPLAGPAPGGDADEKRAFLLCSSRFFLREERFFFFFLQKSLMTAFEVLINPWPCSFKTPWIPWLSGRKNKKKQNTKQIQVSNKVLRQCGARFWNVFIYKELYQEMCLYGAGGGTAWCSEKKSTRSLEEITWGILGKEYNMTHFLKELLWSRDI